MRYSEWWFRCKRQLAPIRQIMHPVLRIEMPEPLRPQPILMKLSKYDLPAYWDNPLGVVQPAPVATAPDEGVGVLKGPAAWFQPQNPNPGGFWAKWHFGSIPETRAMTCRSCQLLGNNPGPQAPAVNYSMTQPQTNQSQGNPSVYSALQLMQSGIINSAGGVNALQPPQTSTPTTSSSSSSGGGNLASPGAPSSPGTSGSSGGGGRGSYCPGGPGCPVKYG